MHGVVVVVNWEPKKPTTSIRGIPLKLRPEAVFPVFGGMGDLTRFRRSGGYDTGGTAEEGEEAAVPQ